MLEIININTTAETLHFRVVLNDATFHNIITSIEHGVNASQYKKLKFSTSSKKPFDTSYEFLSIETASELLHALIDKFISSSTNDLFDSPQRSYNEFCHASVFNIMHIVNNYTELLSYESLKLYNILKIIDGLYEFAETRLVDVVDNLEFHSLIKC